MLADGLAFWMKGAVVCCCISWDGDDVIPGAETALRRNQQNPPAVMQLRRKIAANVKDPMNSGLDQILCAAMKLADDNDKASVVSSWF